MVLGGDANGFQEGEISRQSDWLWLSEIPAAAVHAAEAVAGSSDATTLAVIRRGGKALRFSSPVGIFPPLHHLSQSGE